MGSILLVCSANICRSPMAAGLLRQKLSSENMGVKYHVSSAGVWTLDGQPPSENAIAVMAERGIDITDHIAHTITADDMAETDLILAMSQEHVEMLRNTWPQYAWKVFLLSEMSGKRKDVRDPYGSSLEAYRACVDTISSYIDRGFTRILELS